MRRLPLRYPGTAAYVSLPRSFYCPVRCATYHCATYHRVTYHRVTKKRAATKTVQRSQRPGMPVDWCGS